MKEELNVVMEDGHGIMPKYYRLQKENGKLRITKVEPFPGRKLLPASLDTITLEEYMFALTKFLARHRILQEDKQKPSMVSRAELAMGILPKGYPARK